MDDLISKRALLRHLDMAIECKDCPRNTDGITYQKRCACSEISDICNIITDFATFADVQPVVHGYWKDVMMSEATGWDLSLTGGRDEVCETVCSICGDCCIYGGDGQPYLSKYCPNCGAKMDLE